MAKPSGWRGQARRALMRQQRVHKPRRVTDTRTEPREDEPQERPEIRKDLQHWFKER